MEVTAETVERVSGAEELAWHVAAEVDFENGVGRKTWMRRGLSTATRFARTYERVSAAMAAEGTGPLRDELLSGVRGDVVEVCAGNGISFSHYSTGTTGGIAIEPEPFPRSLAQHVGLIRLKGCRHATKLGRLLDDEQ